MGPGNAESPPTGFNNEIQSSRRRDSTDFIILFDKNISYKIFDIVRNK